MGDQLKIGILGTRGIPNRYGGFEQCAEYLAFGLTQKGHDVWVYNAHNHEYNEGNWKGVHIIYCNDPEYKLGTFGQFIYDYNCIKDARKRNFDILLHLGYTSNSIWRRIWPRGCRNIVNMDGLEWKRSKYSKYVQRFLKSAEKWAATNADVLIADSIGIQQYLKDVYNKPSIYIPYGADIFDAPNPNILEKYTLLPFNFYLLIARIEPENNIETIIKGVINARQDKPLIIIGKTNNTYGKYLNEKYASFEQIQFLGGIYDVPVINNLRYYSLLYFHGHSVGGTNPSLLEAMGCSALIAAHNNTFNKSILDGDAFYFSSAEDIVDIINEVGSKNIYQNKLNNNLKKILTSYNWENIVSKYEQVFLNEVK
jgi:glycosyltransferase involved in cell wall biosynthesis